ncbi:Protein SERAC1 [Madurella mycetomatis]|uniref:Protein SERAC1 n=1 Tax=Madurella mycetomatis TaxID=100816 RepID=A0A175W0U7_9PEZI|nr:Protein SERAC1 [Madurella mycetomatis]
MAATEPVVPTSSLRVICSGVQNPTVDIVSIPSLPQLLPSYQPRDETSWIRDVFSHQFPTARVLLFRYDFAKSPTDVSWLQILREGTTLLYELIHQRSHPKEMNRPLVFICHSFGGMVLKQALLSAKQNVELSSIFKSTIGVLFFGCIHNHTPATFQTACIRCAALEMRIPLGRHEVSASLKGCDKWNILKDTLDKFRQLDIHFPIWSYCETRKTTYKTRRLRLAESLIACEEPLARLNIDKERFFQVDMDHLQISSFPTRGHPLFQQIIAVLNGMLATCKELQVSEEAAKDIDVEQTETTSEGSLSLTIEGSGLATPTSSNGSDDLGHLTEIQTRPLRLPCRSILPHKENLNFVGRSDIILRIHSILQPDNPGNKPNAQSVFALCGLGGVGKTQVAIRFAMEYMASFQAVLFAHADEPANLLADFARFAVDLGLVDPEESDRLYSYVPWLLVFDNADNPDGTILKFWPHCNRGAILITSRDKRLAARFGCQILPPLQEDEAVDLLLKLTSMESLKVPETDTFGDVEHGNNHQEQLQAARQIVHRLGCLPLGIYQAANLIVNDFCLLTEFLSAYDYRDLVTSGGGEGLFHNPIEEPYRHTLLNVWSMNFDSLSEDCQKLLNALSLLNPDMIELDMLASGATKASKAGERGWSIIDSPRKLAKQKAMLLHSSLLDQNHMAKTLSMHRLVQASCQYRMTPEQRQQAFHMASSLLHHVWPVAPRKNRHRPDLWPTQGRLLPHVLSMCRFYESSQQEDKTSLVGTREFAELLYNASWHNYERGTFEHSEPLLRAAEHYCLGHDGCELILADIYGARASVATETNQPSLALENFTLQYEFIDRAVKRGMVELPDIRYCFGVGGMGNGTHSMGQYEDAERWYRKCFDAFEGLNADKRIYGGNLAFCLIWQGKLDKTQEVIDPIINSVPDTGFRTGYIMYPLGNLQIARGEMDNAFKTHSDALRIYRLSLGDKHHRTADLCHKVGWHHHARKEYAQAVELLNRALAVYEARPTWYRNERARTKYKLGCVLQDMGKIEEGSQLINDAEQIRRDILGPNVLPGGERDFDALVMFWSR